MTSLKGAKEKEKEQRYWKVAVNIKIVQIVQVVQLHIDLNCGEQIFLFEKDR